METRKKRERERAVNKNMGKKRGRRRKFIAVEKREKVESHSERPFLSVGALMGN